ncbi:ATP-binding protein [Allopusillimonas ginsengisoli]|uniref:ATP-binding protein n=1 Tax=Allopusillimonas ginsengisoli TaxID=453575 RepID=UPI001FD64A61|nr:ATP-binding protein [Allopusillimonas ginsengisoli]
MASVDAAALIGAEIKKAQYAAAKQRNESIAQDVFRRAAIPPRFAARKLSTFNAHCDSAAEALNIARSYASDFDGVLETGRSLIFVGGVGAGKTHLATGIAHSVMEQGYCALFSSVIGAVRSVKETYRRDSSKSESDAILALIKPDLLILDEVGVQFGSDAEKLILFEIINGRYEHMRPTIVISNLALAGLKEYLGERIIDRLREGGGKQVVFDWPSYRLRRPS